MSRLIAMLGGALILYALKAEGTESDSSNHNCSSTEMTFEDWRHWTSVTPVPVRSKGHSNNWVGIYVNKLAEVRYLSASSYQVCAKIVKPIYTDANGKNVRKLTFMVKNASWL